MQFKKPGIAGRFWLIREVLALTLKDLGETGDVSHQSIKNIIAGETQSPGMVMVGKICDRWGISLEWMVYERGPIFLTTPDRRTIQRANDLGISLDDLVGRTPDVLETKQAKSYRGANDRVAELANFDSEINFLGEALRSNASRREETSYRAQPR